MVNIIATYSHPKYTNGKEIEKIYKAYRKKMHDQNLPVEISGVLNELGIWATTWDKYINFNPDDDLCITEKEKQGYIERSQICKKIETECASDLAQWGMSNPKSQAMAMFLLKQKRNGGYTDKQEFTTTGNVSIAVKLTDEHGKQIK